MHRRRRSPAWVRQMDARQLHATAGKLQRLRATDGVSVRQEWLWDALISELEYRRRREKDPWKMCLCEFCCDPFDFADEVRRRDEEEGFGQVN